VAKKPLHPQRCPQLQALRSHRQANRCTLRRSQVGGSCAGWCVGDSGELDREEMRQGLQKLGYPLGAADLDQLLLLLDSDGDGRVHLTEFEHMAR
jgi:hypothetical protein